jgi:hypothetical protein
MPPHDMATLGGSPMDHARMTFAKLERSRIPAAVMQQLDAIQRSAHHSHVGLCYLSRGRTRLPCLIRLHRGNKEQGVDPKLLRTRPRPRCPPRARIKPGLRPGRPLGRGP